MPFVLPGLFDFTTGVSSAINQNAGRLANEGQVTDNYLATLNAFNASLNTNDNLELRQGFASQPAGTSILDRFSNFAQQSTNPFAVNQAITAGSALSPLLAQTSLQNPFFGAQQGIPQTAEAQAAQGFLGFNPLFQQNFNAQLPQLLAQANPGLNPAALATVTAGTQDLGVQNQQNETILRENQALQQQLAELRRTIAAQGTVTPATATLSTTNPRPVLSNNRQGTITPVPQIGGTVGGAASRTGN